MIIQARPPCHEWWLVGCRPLSTSALEKKRLSPVKTNLSAYTMATDPGVWPGVGMILSSLLVSHSHTPTHPIVTHRKARDQETAWDVRVEVLRLGAAELDLEVRGVGVPAPVLRHHIPRVEQAWCSECRMPLAVIGRVVLVREHCTHERSSRGCSRSGLLLGDTTGILWEVDTYGCTSPRPAP